MLRQLNLHDFLDEETYQDYLKQKEYLKQISTYSLPSKPSQRGYSADDIKRKMYEPVFQLLDWMYGIKGVAGNGKVKMFSLDISSLMNLDFENAIIKLQATSIGKENFDLLDEYYDYTGVKRLIVEINKSYLIFQVEVELTMEGYTLRGVGLAIESECLFSITMNISKRDYSLIGEIKLVNEMTDIRNEIDNMKTEIMEYISNNYIKKKDIKSVNCIKQGDETIESLTEGGFITINTTLGGEK